MRMLELKINVDGELVLDIMGFIYSYVIILSCVETEMSERFLIVVFN